MYTTISGFCRTTHSSVTILCDTSEINEVGGSGTEWQGTASHCQPFKERSFEGLHDTLITIDRLNTTESASLFPISVKETAALIMRCFKHAVIVITIVVIKCIQGTEVAPGSNCSSLCIDQIGADESSPYTSTTMGNMLVCNDWELAGPNATATGEKWRSCLGCESTSAYYDPVSRENDVYWFLRKPYYCLREAVTWS